MALGFLVLRLVRWGIGEWAVEGVGLGEWREGAGGNDLDVGVQFP